MQILESDHYRRSEVPAPQAANSVLRCSTNFGKWALSGTDGAEEAAHFGLQPIAFAGQRAGRRQYLRGRRASLAGAALNLGDAGRDLLRAGRRLVDVAGDFLRRTTLLLDACGDRRRNLRQPPDGGADIADGADRLLRRVLNVRDLLADFTCRFRGLFGQRLDLGGDDGETPPRLAGSR